MTKEPLSTDATTQVRAGDTIAEFVSTSKQYGAVLAADRLSLRIRRGEFLSFLGPSGCGKTTALRMLAGFESPTDGGVLIDRKDVSKVPAYKRPVNMVFQQYALFPHMTVAQNVGYGLRQQRPRMPKAEIAAKVQKALATVRLEAFGPRRIWEMSGGQQQRVALARAIVNEPKILLLDEPMAALDAKLRSEMQHELLALQRSLGITFVLVTHDQEEALAMSDRICIMGKGRIAQVGTPQDLYDRPRSRYVADFVGKANILEAQLTRVQGDTGTATLANGIAVHPQVFAGDTAPRKAEIAIRPEVLSLAAAGAPLPEGTAALPARITHRTFLGDHTEYLLVAEGIGPLQVNVPRQAERVLGGHDVEAMVQILWPAGTGLVLAAEATTA
ncbi:ABC transporter ATP-binding protein [Pseudooceanicola sp. CBS1P-1]|uniref:Spermidine/putrescine import ATP-binding protein PotA n=1 Tax=Pseudooceanicola albus TaxID=2692189 RepID=A0A6L7G6G9_9RHOB|nr:MULTISPECIES: ABC transporter ATP-binding protein [Pseudooceanicola]MBT9386050.1 ABC transporter ATP-binding protein [Pseudooceanicola endophyticus]MXN19529.1 polyamine ABC transporter ATP-binding protein [Pseudooceanicola albus]